MLTIVGYIARLGLSIALLILNTSAISLLLSHITGAKNLAPLATNIFCGAVILAAFSALAFVL